MPALAGKNCVVFVSTTGLSGPWNEVLELKDANLQEKATGIDVSQFGDTFMERILGLKDAQLTLQGFWDPADTTGQVAIRNNWLTDAALYIAVAFDGSTGFKMQGVTSSFQIQAQINGAVTLNATVDSTGAIAAYP